MNRKHATVSDDHAEESRGPLKAKRKRMRNRPPLTQMQQRLALHYLPLARSLAKPMKKRWPAEYEEFDSAAYLALVEAAQSYDHSRRVKFATYARFRICGALRDVQRRLIVAGWEDDPENAPELHALPLDIEELGRPLNTRPERSVEEKLEADDSFEHWLRKLPRQHAAACREVYLHEKTQIQVAEMFGCSKSRVSYLLKQSMKMLNDAHRWKDAARDEEPGRGNERDDEGAQGPAWQQIAR